MLVYRRVKVPFGRSHDVFFFFVVVVVFFWWHLPWTCFFLNRISSFHDIFLFLVLFNVLFITQLGLASKTFPNRSDDLTPWLLLRFFVFFSLVSFVPAIQKNHPHRHPGTWSLLWSHPKNLVTPFFPDDQPLNKKCFACFFWGLTPPENSHVPWRIKGLEDKPFLLKQLLFRGHSLVFRGHVDFWGFPVLFWRVGSHQRKIHLHQAIADAAEISPCPEISNSAMLLMATRNPVVFTTWDVVSVKVLPFPKAQPFVSKVSTVFLPKKIRERSIP